ncbi:MAG TPA: hypothetical protein VMR06_02095 [Dokdonella sp.]|uniref:hypothetical protein n=1 Tax=Dokdonella sp. TaxID=2291710 RepID=UPI002B9FFCE9|nr:hypothetical protein [Dokdonella sp.]HUD40767.1 hypothetical protein [Dokdonella sp.]
MKGMSSLLGLAGMLLGLCGTALAGPPVNTLVWTVRDVERSYGFIVYRSQAEHGPFRRLNAALIRVGTGTNEYRYVDRDVRPGAVYYYRIDAVSLTGINKPLGKPLSKKTGSAAAETPD